jgi:hypothetical protein
MKNLLHALAVTTISAFFTPLAHAAPFDIVQCMTISQAGSYRLAGNLQSGLGDCLVVLTDNVSIDLAGFTIRGRSRGAGIRAKMASGAAPNAGETIGAITIRGGTVTGFDVGIDVDDGAVVENMHIVGNEYEGIRASLGHLVARSNTIRFNARTLDRRAAGIQAGAHSLITGNLVTNQGVAGEGITYVCPSVVTHNVVASNGPPLNQRNMYRIAVASTLSCIMEKNVDGIR